MRRWIGVAACALVALAGAPAAAGTYAIRNARIVPVSGPPIERGTILLRNGRIAAIGRGVRIPPEARIIEAEGLTAYPGLIEASTRLGLAEIGSVRATQDSAEQGEMKPQLTAAVAVNPHSELIPVTRANGITTVLSRPAGGVISGQAVLMDLAGWTIEEMAIRPRAALVIRYPGAGETQQRRLEALEALLAKAQSTPDPADATPFDLAVEALRPYVRGERPVILEADTAEEIRGAVALAEKFRLKAILSGVREGYRVTDLLKAKGFPCLVGDILAQPANTNDPYDANYANPAALYRAGIPFAIVSGETSNARNLPYHAAMASAFGLPPDAALAAITLMPARILGIDRDYGSLEVGKVGNLFLATGSPLDPRTRVTAVFIRGEPIDMENRHEALYRRFLRRLEAGNGTAAPPGPPIAARTGAARVAAGPKAQRAPAPGRPRPLVHGAGSSRPGYTPAGKVSGRS